MNLKYSDTAENKCFAETSVSANFKYIFHSDCISGSTLINVSLRTVDLPVQIQIGSFVSCEEARSPVTSSRYQPFPHQGKSKCLVSSSSHHILLCAVFRRKLFSCTFGEDFQQSLGTMKSQPAALQNQPSLVLGSLGNVPPPFLHSMVCVRARGKRRACCQPTREVFTPP